MIPHLNLILDANSGLLRSGLIQSRQAWDQFTGHLTSGARTLTKSMAGVYASMNGMSAISKLAMAAGGTMLAKDALDRNLQFEKMVLDMKQTAEMTRAEAAELRQKAIDLATPTLSLPIETMEAMQSLTAAGMKVDQLRKTIGSTMIGAVAFRVTGVEKARMDFDLLEKMKIRPDQLGAANNILLAHAKDGRFEAPAMAREAPRILNAGAHVGITGLKGVNFLGAFSEVLMKLVPVGQEAEVSTYMEHALAHITDQHYVKKLKKVGIDVKKYMPDGKFYGEGGNDGIFDLLEAMDKKGLQDSFKASKAGFREMYTRKAWQQAIKYRHEMRNVRMANAQAKVGDNMVEGDATEIKGSNYGKIKKLAIEKEKIQLGETATGAVGKVADLAEWASQNPKTAAAGAVVATMAATYGLNKLKQRVFKGNSPVDKVGKGIGGDGTRVFVTNWPDCICGGAAGKLKASERLAQLPGRRLVEAGASTTAGAAATGGMSTAAAVGLGATMIALPAAIAYGFKQWEQSAAGKASDDRRYNLELVALDRRIAAAKATAAIDPAQLAALLKQRAVIVANMTVPPPPATQPPAPGAAPQPVAKPQQILSAKQVDKMLAGQQPRLAAMLKEMDARVKRELAKGDDDPTAKPEQWRAEQAAVAKLMGAVYDKNKQPALAKTMADLESRIAKAKANVGGDDAGAAPQKLLAERDELARLVNVLINELRQSNERPIQINLDSKPLVEAVNKRNGRDARRQ
jgi:hypothetical protein